MLRKMVKSDFRLGVRVSRWREMKWSEVRRSGGSGDPEVRKVVSRGKGVS